MVDHDASCTISKTDLNNVTSTVLLVDDFHFDFQFQQHRDSGLAGSLCGVTRLRQVTSATCDACGGLRHHLTYSLKFLHGGYIGEHDGDY